MKLILKLSLIGSLLIFIYSCTHTVPSGHSSVMENKYDYVAEYRNRGATASEDASEQIWGLLTLGTSTYNRYNLPYVGYGNTIEEAKLNALGKCQQSIRADSLKARHKCVLQFASKTSKSNRGIVETSYFEQSIDRYKKQCAYIGFKPNSESFSQCVFELKKTEMQITLAKNQNPSYSNDDTLKNLLILNESMKLLNPPRRGFRCQTRPFGIYTNVYCN